MDPPPEPRFTWRTYWKTTTRTFRSREEPLSTLKSIIIILGGTSNWLSTNTTTYFYLRKGLFRGSRRHALRAAGDILRINASFEFMRFDGVDYIFDHARTLLRLSGDRQEDGVKDFEKIVASICWTMFRLESRLDDIAFTKRNPLLHRPCWITEYRQKWSSPRARIFAQRRFQIDRRTSFC